MNEDESAVEATAARLGAGLEDGFKPNFHHCVNCLYQSRCQPDVSWPASAESPIVWPTFNFPD
ncbi:hypothetical protein D3C78_1624620 [compost metagenome]